MKLFLAILLDIVILWIGGSIIVGGIVSGIFGYDSLSSALLDLSWLVIILYFFISLEFFGGTLGQRILHIAQPIQIKQNSSVSATRTNQLSGQINWREIIGSLAKAMALTLVAKLLVTLETDKGPLNPPNDIAVPIFASYIFYFIAGYKKFGKLDEGLVPTHALIGGLIIFLFEIAFQVYNLNSLSVLPADFQLWEEIVSIFLWSLVLPAVILFGVYVYRFKQFLIKGKPNLVY